MPTKEESFAHGSHNQAACELLHLNGQFPDWTITTAFYASLHFVTSKIFPFKHEPKPGAASVTFADLSGWQKFKSYGSNKRHELICNLVAKYCPEISPEYDWLLNTSWNARYHHHQHPKEIVERALSCMKTIKKHCDPAPPKTKGASPKT